MSTSRVPEPTTEVERQLEMASSPLAVYARDLKRVLERGREQARELATAYQQLQASSAETEWLLASIPSMLIGVGPDDRITCWNRAAETVFGIAAADAVGRPFLECGIQREWIEVFQRILDCRTKGCLTRLEEICYARPDGKNGFVELTINPIMRGADRQPAFLLLGVDITERKHLEAQLVLAQKLESIGQLAAGIAHEINTPIQYVGDNTRFLRDTFCDVNKLLRRYVGLLEANKVGSVTPEMVAEVEATAAETDVEYLSEEIPRAIQQSLEGVKRVAEIVRAMKEFSHPGTEDKMPIDLNRSIKTTLTVARNEWKYVADMVTDLDPSLPPVPCQPGKFNQVILNLIINAAHAITEVVGDGSNGKGTITVSTYHDDDYAEIRIRDTGTGIPEAIRAKIFDPFFTTKEVGKGTGQGLAIAHSVIVNKHGGTVAFETEVGAGTTFIIRLPLAPSLPQKGDYDEKAHPLR